MGAGDHRIRIASLHALYIHTRIVTVCHHNRYYNPLHDLLIVNTKTIARSESCIVILIPLPPLATDTLHVDPYSSYELLHRWH